MPCIMHDLVPIYKNDFVEAFSEIYVNVNLTCS